jgi:hypothetical protein
MKLIKRTKEGETIDQAIINWDYKSGHYVRLVFWFEKFIDRQIYMRLRWYPKPIKFFINSNSISQAKKVYRRAMGECVEE